MGVRGKFFGYAQKKPHKLYGFKWHINELSSKQKRRCKKTRNKARGFPRYGSPRALIYHTAKKNYLILKKGYSKHTGRNTALFADH